MQGLLTGPEFQAELKDTELTAVDQSFPADLENFFNVGGGTIDLKLQVQPKTLSTLLSMRLCGQLMID